MSTKPHPSRPDTAGKYIVNLVLSPRGHLQLLRLQELRSRGSTTQPQTSLSQVLREAVFDALARELEFRATPENESDPWTEELCRLLAGLDGADPLTEEEQRSLEIHRRALRERVAPAKKKGGRR